MIQLLQFITADNGWQWICQKYVQLLKNTLILNCKWTKYKLMNILLGNIWNTVKLTWNYNKCQSQYNYLTIIM